MASKKEALSFGKRRNRSIYQYCKSLLSALLLTAATASAHAAGVPEGFQDRQIYSGFVSPSALTVLPDGRVLVVQQDGTIRMVKNDTLLSANFYKVPNVEPYVETGCLGITSDPAFMSNGYVYLYCTVKTGTDYRNRVLRITAAGDVAAAGSERLILDLGPILPDPVDGTRIYTHLGGAMRFGSDGKLYVAVGGHENSRVTPEQNSYSQRLSSPFGKILRINRDGSFPADNPFFNTAGAYRGVYSLGLRNPHTMDIQSGTGRILINDVGAGSVEEILDGKPGANYGWPFHEGDAPATQPQFTNALYTYAHDVDPSGRRRCAITGGTFYNALNIQFPGTYADKYFFSDYCTGSIYTLDPNNPAGDNEFATGILGPVNLSVGPDGSMYYLARNTNPEDNLGMLGKIEYSGTNTPRIAQHPRSQTIYLGDPVTFSILANGATRIQWQRNGVNIPGATSASYRIANTTMADSGAVFNAVTENAFGTTTSSPAVLTVTTNRLPQVSITSPNENTGYATGDTIRYAASANDVEDGSVPASAFTWQANFRHDTHAHPLLAATGGVTSGSVSIPEFESTTANTWIEFLLTVKDSAGQAQTATRNIYPRHQFSLLRSSGTPVNGLGPIEIDRHNGNAAAKDGGQLSLDTVPYPKGLGVHAPSDVRYNLGGICSGRLIADVGVDDSVGDSGSVVFQVYLDGAKAYDSGLVRGSDLRKAVNVDVTGKRELRLVVADGGDGNSLDRANWGGVRLSCNTLPEDTLAPSSSGGAIASPGGGGGCTTGRNGRFDPTLAGLALSALAVVAWRRRRTPSRAKQ
jgi:glucose/arabinose dehydrogenase